MNDRVESEAPGTRGGGDALPLLLSWFWVGVPLAWGVFETLRTSLALFQ
jgi:hypothetical protein